MRRNIPNAELDGRNPEMPSDHEPDGSLTEFELDNLWYESFVDKVRTFGKHWPDPLTAYEYDQCEVYADSIVRRPKSEEFNG
jgi:hypothetical protein